VIANGDIGDAATACRARQMSGADGVMVGRAAQGAPWLLAQIAAALFATPTPPVPRGAARAEMVIAHYQDMLSFYGRDLGLRVARKHLGWYMDRAGSDAALRRRVLTEGDPNRVSGLLWRAIAPDARAAA